MIGTSGDDVRRRAAGILVVAGFLVAVGCESGDVGTVSAAKASGKGAASGPAEGSAPAAKAGKKGVDESRAPQREALPKAARRKG
ncbi:hypothetical protein OJF2_67190 [Aquisphaera giovannonii]|uniref:Uncharacterized protein n=1 Tax=Aquisphaera giovannonii TaxID=406548 RepID=A0A5B9WDT1_9BACT|nr:hypothetical protein [Aquisphaera giovannonii]QEH38121.1 hypothetical protein OJF2_67190 [Aquisphaera giovannonii]